MTNTRNRACSRSVYVLIPLALVVTLTWSVIEILNARAGFYLPRELPEGAANAKWRYWPDTEWMWRAFDRDRPKSLANPEMPLGYLWPLPEPDKALLLRVLEDNKSRFRPEEYEELKRTVTENDPERGVPAGQSLLMRKLTGWMPMTAQEEARMRRDLAEAKAMNRLHLWVESMGLLQYLLAPLCWLVSLYVAVLGYPRRSRLVGLASLCTASIGIALMLYRGYIESLGW